MKRLTTDTPDGNFETMLNFVFGRDGWAHIRHDGETGPVPLTQWAKSQCILNGCDEFPAETPQEIDEEITDCMMDFSDCPIALAYCFASQAVHLRTRLKMYEDILFSEDGTERVTLDNLRELAQPNAPLTLDELREMDGEPVYLCFGPGCGEWVLVKIKGDYILLRHKNGIPANAKLVLNFGGKFYRRKPEEGQAPEDGTT